MHAKTLQPACRVLRLRSRIHERLRGAHVANARGVALRLAAEAPAKATEATAS